MAGGSLDQLGLIENAEEDFKNATKQTLNTNGDSSTLMGVRMPLEIPPQGPGSNLSDNLDNSPKCTEVFGKLYRDTIDAIDTAIPSGPCQPVFDPTISIPIDLMIELGVDLDWLSAKLPELMGPDLLLTIPKIAAGCDVEPFLDEMNAIGAGIEKEGSNGGIAKLEAVCSLIIEFPEISFSPPSLELPGLDILPVDLQITLNFGDIVMGITDIIASFFANIGDWVLAMMGGVAGFVIELIKWLIGEFIELMSKIFKFLKTAALLAAQAITYVSKVIAALVVALVGLMVGAGGLVTAAVAGMLGLGPV
jgi:hypothetical protein